MYAIIETGAKQYCVRAGDVIRVERLAGEEGETVSLDRVLLVESGGERRIGAPVIEGARVQAEILEQRRDKKILVFKKRRRKNYRRTAGHRQYRTVLRVKEILGGTVEGKA